MSIRAALCVGLYLLVCLRVPAQQDVKPHRRALLIINGKYKNLTPLDSPALDEAVLRTALGKTGFEVTTITDAGVVSFPPPYRAFVNTINAGDAALIYFSGYAVRNAEGDENYLLPVDFDPKATPKPSAAQAYPLSQVFIDLERRKPSVKIVLVDGAREESRLTPIGTGLVNPDISGSAQGAGILLSTETDKVRPRPAAGQPDPLARIFSQVIQVVRSEGTDVVFALNESSSRLFKETGTAGATLIQALPQPFFFTDAPPPPPPPKPEIITVTKDNFTEVPQINSVDRQPYVFIKSGSFQMGCVPPAPGKKDTCEANEKPQHEVRITKDFWMGQTEATVGAYYRYLGKKKKPGLPFWLNKLPMEALGEYPIVNVTWDEAQDFCKYVGGELPSEAQWEYAARAGETNPYPFSGNEINADKANFSGQQGNDTFQYTAPVKKFDANAWKLFDMSGNVWEWTADWYSADYYASSPKDDPKGPAGGKEKVYRGGSFRSEPSKHLRISYRDKIEYGKKGYADFLGFRCVMQDSPETRKLLGAK